MTTGSATPNFGMNWNAFDECIQDLEWLRASWHLILIFESDQILVDEDVSEFECFMDTLENASLEWSQPIALGQPYDRPGIPFHVVFQYRAECEGALPGRLAALPIWGN